jgi:hypothetical protein
VSIDEALQLAVADAARGVVTFPVDLHGFPGTVHGGAAAAAFHRLALPRPPVELRLSLLRGVPTATPLRVRSGSRGATAHLALVQDERVLAEATLRRDGLELPEAGALREAWASGQAALEDLPRTQTCLACGSTNPVGLALRLRATDRIIGQEYRPPPAYRIRDGGAHPALAFIALDELAWWLGALAQGECGVTTDVRVTVYQPLPDAPLLLLGDRAVTNDDADGRGRYCRARGVLLDPGGTLLAAADVRFAGSRAYTRRLLDAFLGTSELDLVARWFPSARDLVDRRIRG